MTDTVREAFEKDFPVPEYLVWVKAVNAAVAVLNKG
jgi:hypothetical protein